MTNAEVASLHTYPVKSCRGISLASAKVTHLGLQYDRHWMMVTPEGRFVSQRHNPRLALIETALTAHGLQLSFAGTSVSVPYSPPDGKMIDARIWADDCVAVDEGPDVSTWLTRVLDSDFPVRLVRMAPNSSRPKSNTDVLGDDATTQFADAGPFSFASEASLTKLNDTLERAGHEPVPMNRFRPNVVIRGLPPFGEHGLQELATGDIRFRLCYPIARCIMTTIDQETAIKHPDMQPFNTLRTLNPTPDDERKPAFAQ